MLKLQKNQMTKTERAAATDNDGLSLMQEKQVFFSGSIPHPDILKGYSDIDSSFPERILKIAESHDKTEDDAQQSLVRGNVVSAILGQILSFIFGVVGIGAAVFLGIHGNTMGAVAASVAVIVQAVVSAIVNKKG